MNLKQKICLWVGIIAVVLMGIFPPWVFSISEGGTTVRQNLGYKFILTPAEQKIEEVSLMARLDFSRLCVQWALVAAVTGGLIITFKDNKKN